VTEVGGLGSALDDEEDEDASEGLSMEEVERFREFLDNATPEDFGKL
jgi:hypothetical protein